MMQLKVEQQKRLKKLLTDERERLTDHLEARRDSPAVSMGELSSCDNHPAEFGTETFERSQDMALDDASRERLNEVERALARMREGEYGTCEVCGEDIPFERLESVPETLRCIRHADSGLSDARPVEEEVMTAPPSGAGEARLRQDDRFDEADAWAALEEYGNASDTVNPQELESAQGERDMERANSRAK